MSLPTFKRAIHRLALEAKVLPDRIKDFLLGRLSEGDRYRRGMISMRASLENLRRNGFAPGFIVDVGAYRGDWSRMARAVFPGVPICLCEANPEKEALLRAATVEIGVADYRIGLLGSKPTDAVTFHVCETGSSVLPQTAVLPSATATLPMTTLDLALSGVATQSGPYFLKLDVQGFELEILRGAELTLGKAEAVLLEVSLLEYNRGAPLFAEVVAFMHERGFAAYDVSGFYRRESDDALYMLDLIFVREDSSLRAKKHFWRLEAAYEEKPHAS